jgi:hypothetical protein
VLTSTNQSYLIIGFKQPINFKKNMIWHIKTKKIWIATVNYQRIAKNFKFFEISQIVNRQKRQQKQIL